MNETRLPKSEQPQAHKRQMDRGKIFGEALKLALAAACALVLWVHFDAGSYSDSEDEPLFARLFVKPLCAVLPPHPTARGATKGPCLVFAESLTKADDLNVYMLLAALFGYWAMGALCLALDLLLPLVTQENRWHKWCSPALAWKCQGGKPRLSPRQGLRAAAVSMRNLLLVAPCLGLPLWFGAWRARWVARYARYDVHGFPQGGATAAHAPVLMSRASDVGEQRPGQDQNAAAGVGFSNTQRLGKNPSPNTGESFSNLGPFGDLWTQEVLVNLPIHGLVVETVFYWTHRLLHVFFFVL